MDKDIIKKIVEGMAKPCYVAGSGSVWGFDLDWVLEEADGQAIAIYDCPADYWPECDDDWPAPEWFVIEVR